MFRLISFVSTSLLFVCIVFVGTLLAQDNQANRQFQKNYVKGLPLGSQAQTEHKGKELKENQKTQKIRRFSKALPTPTKARVVENLNAITSNVVEVQALGALLWAGDFTHFRTSLQSFTQVVSEHNLLVSEVVIVTPPDLMVPVMMYINVGPLTGVLASRSKDLLRIPSVAKRLQAEPGLFEKAVAAARASSGMSRQDSPPVSVKVEQFTRLENRWRIVPYLPDEYAFLEHSPTYVVHTKHGTILLEGQKKDLKTYFDKKGNFKIGPYKMYSGNQEISSYGVEQ